MLTVRSTFTLPLPRLTFLNKSKTIHDPPSMIDAANLSEGLLTLHISNWQEGRGGVSSSKFSKGWVNIQERKMFINFLSMLIAMFRKENFSEISYQCPGRINLFWYFSSHPQDTFCTSFKRRRDFADVKS